MYGNRSCTTYMKPALVWKNRRRKIASSRCCTPKFSLLLIKDFHKIPFVSRLHLVWSAQDTSSGTDDWKLGCEIAQGFLNFQCPIWLSWIIMDPRDYSCQVSSFGSHFWSINWTVDLKINYIAGKVNHSQFTVKLHNFLSTTTF